MTYITTKLCFNHPCIDIDLKLSEKHSERIFTVRCISRRYASANLELERIESWVYLNSKVYNFFREGSKLKLEQTVLSPIGTTDTPILFGDNLYSVHRKFINMVDKLIINAEAQTGDEVKLSISPRNTPKFY